MMYRRYTPAPPLSALVGCIWYSEGLQGTHTRERLLPNGESAIVIDLRDGPMTIYDGESVERMEACAPAIFCGARTDCFVIDTSRQERVIGIQFRPGGAFPFLFMPAGEAANATYNLDEIWPGCAGLLREELMSVGSVDAMFAILERTLVARLRSASMLHPAVVYAARLLARPSVQVRIGDVADRVGLSSRRLIEVFRDQTGLTPKAFQRVRRFQEVLNALRNPLAEQRVDLAMRFGYFDQAHFNHDFRHFSGMTPGEYMGAATAHLNHVPLK